MMQRQEEIGHDEPLMARDIQGQLNGRLYGFL